MTYRRRAECIKYSVCSVVLLQQSLLFATVDCCFKVDSSELYATEASLYGNFKFTKVREFVEERALQLGVTGICWFHSLNELFIILESTRENIEKMFAWIRKGRPGIEIKKVEITLTETIEKRYYHDFEILRFNLPKNLFKHMESNKVYEDNSTSSEDLMKNSTNFDEEVKRRPLLATMLPGSNKKLFYFVK